MPRRRSAIVWALPAIFVHLLLLIAVFMSSRRVVPVARPLPRWAILLTPAEISESYRSLPPPPPASLPIPRLERPAVRLPESEPFTQPAPVPVDAPAPGPGAAPPPVRTGPIGPGIGAPRPPVAERLRPGNGDPRLYLPLPEEIVGLSQAQLAQLEMDLAVAEVVDSIEVAEAAGRRATDWTYTDSQGRRWGVSPGQIHLGGITIPLPFGFRGPRSAEATRAAMQDAEIAAQAERLGATAVLKDRAAEIRKRRDAERARARARPQADTAGGE